MNGHCWAVKERIVYDKTGEFDPKTMPIADYWQSFECSICGEIRTEVGYIRDGQDLPYGMSMSFNGCVDKSGGFGIMKE